MAGNRNNAAIPGNQGPDPGHGFSIHRRRSIAGHPRPFVTPEQRATFDEFYPSGLPVGYEMVERPGDGSESVPDRYVEASVPAGFYTNPPIGAQALFSTISGRKPFRSMQHILPAREIHLWRAEEVQAVCNSLRRVHWQLMRGMHKPTTWIELYFYFDSYDLYHYGVTNLCNVICHLVDENSFISPVVDRECDLEVGHWVDKWLERNGNKNKLRSWNPTAASALQAVARFFTAADWVSLGPFPDEKFHILSDALHHRRHLLLSAGNLTSERPRNLVAALNTGSLQNWLAGQQVYSPSGLPVQPESRPGRRSSQPAITPVNNSNRVYSWGDPRYPNQAGSSQGPLNAVESLQQSSAAAVALTTERRPDTGAVVANGSNRPQTRTPPSAPRVARPSQSAPAPAQNTEAQSTEAQSNVADVTDQESDNRSGVGSVSAERKTAVQENEGNMASTRHMPRNRSSSTPNQPLVDPSVTLSSAIAAIGGQGAEQTTQPRQEPAGSQEIEPSNPQSEARSAATPTATVGPPQQPAQPSSSEESVGATDPPARLSSITFGRFEYGGRPTERRTQGGNRGEGRLPRDAAHSQHGSFPQPQHPFGHDASRGGSSGRQRWQGRNSGFDQNTSVVMPPPPARAWGRSRARSSRGAAPSTPSIQNVATPGNLPQQLPPNPLVGPPSTQRVASYPSNTGVSMPAQQVCQNSEANSSYVPCDCSNCFDRNRSVHVTVDHVDEDHTRG